MVGFALMGALLVTGPDPAAAEAHPAAAATEARLPAATAAGVEQPAGGAATAAPAAELGRSGLFGWGLGLELPLAGVLTGFGAESRVGSGYSLGGALSWEVTPCILARAHFTYDQSYGGRASLSYVDSVQDQTRSLVSQEANWLGIALGLGGAYLFRASDRQWSPYLGADAAVRFAGFDYLFDEVMAPYASTGELSDNDLAQCRDPSCGDDWHDGLGLGWMATLRGGVRLELASWLQSQLDIAVSYTRTGDERVSNTLLRRDVRATEEEIYLVRTTFAVRLGL